MTTYRPAQKLFHGLGQSLSRDLKLKPGLKHVEYDLELPLTEIYGIKSGDAAGEGECLLEVGVRSPELNYAMFKTILHTHHGSSVAAACSLQPDVRVCMSFEVCGKLADCDNQAWVRFIEQARDSTDIASNVADTKIKFQTDNPQAHHMQELKELTEAFLRLTHEIVGTASLFEI